MRMATIFNEFLDRKACRNFRHLPKYRDLSGKFVAAHAADVPSLEKHGALRGFLQAGHATQQCAFAGTVGAAYRSYTTGADRDINGCQRRRTVIVDG